MLRNLSNRVGKFKLLAASSAGLLALGVFAVGSGAAPSPLAPVSEVLGIGGDHGAAVSDAVHEAKARLMEDDPEGAEGKEELGGPDVGAAVSEAACDAAHDRTTLPDGAQNAPGQQKERPEKDCTHSSNVEGGDEPDPAAVSTEPQGEGMQNESTDNHGSAVSQAVHGARESVEAGEKVGPAVSEAACNAAHDRTTLPDGAQNAPGQQGREPKDCTHPSNAGVESNDTGVGNAETFDGPHEPESSPPSNSRGRGRDSAPGQQKK